MRDGGVGAVEVVADHGVEVLGPLAPPGGEDDSGGTRGLQGLYLVGSSIVPGLGPAEMSRPSTRF